MVFHKKAHIFSKFTHMMINLRKIFIRCCWRNTNSKNFDKIWLLDCWL